MAPNLAIVADIKVLPTDQTVTSISCRTTVVKNFLYLVPSATVRLHRHRCSGKTRWRRTNIGCAKSIRPKIGDLDACVHKTKLVCNFIVNSVVTQQGFDGKRTHIRRTKLLARQVQVNFFQKVQHTIPERKVRKRRMTNIPGIL
jgi:hypothetical protein